jgi:hypothetical protein
MQNEYGLPLDNRADFAKTDWEMWAAANMGPEQANSLIEAVFRSRCLSHSSQPDSRTRRSSACRSVTGTRPVAAISRVSGAVL